VNTDDIDALRPELWVVARVAHHVAEELQPALRVIRWVCVVLLVLVVALGLMVIKQNQSRTNVVRHIDANTQQTEMAASEARAAAQKASSDLTAALAQAKANAIDLTPVQSAFDAVFRIDCTLNHTPESCAHVSGR
jgi:Tfp pilus assembly protein PilX